LVRHVNVFMAGNYSKVASSQFAAAGDSSRLPASSCQPKNRDLRCLCWKPATGNGKRVAGNWKLATAP
jgi:hypothetical protein